MQTLRTPTGRIVDMTTTIQLPISGLSGGPIVAPTNDARGTHQPDSTTYVGLPAIGDELSRLEQVIEYLKVLYR
jgi:hypothetical protein